MFNKYYLAVFEYRCTQYHKSIVVKARSKHKAALKAIEYTELGTLVDIKELK